MIPFKNRFHGRNSIRFVYSKGDIFRSRFVTLKTIKNNRESESRLAVVISKKTLKSAVKRNLIRRRVYGYLNSQIAEFNGVYDIAFIVTSSEILSLNHKQLADLIDSLLKESKIPKGVNNVNN